MHNESPGGVASLATTYREEVLQVGGPVPLHGVVTHPGYPLAQPLVLVIGNSGLLHHVGSCGFSVALAREAAAHGIMTVRWDASGVGDSAARASALPQDQRTVAELHEVLAHMAQQYGVSRFALMGLCSGAFTAFTAALDTPAVYGVVQIAPFTYRTAGWYVRHYGPRVTDSARWRSFLARQLGASTPRRRTLDAQFLESYDAGWDTPPQEQVEAGYRTLLARRVHLLNIMTGGEADSYLYHGQFRDMFPALDFGPTFEEVYLPEATHTLTAPAHQRAVRARIVQWLMQLATST